MVRSLVSACCQDLPSHSHVTAAIILSATPRFTARTLASGRRALQRVQRVPRVVNNAQALARASARISWSERLLVLARAVRKFSRFVERKDNQPRRKHIPSP